MSYIKIPSCLILAVTPANSDLANSDALQMAGIADPDGEALKILLGPLDLVYCNFYLIRLCFLFNPGYRTIGVITKVQFIKASNRQFHNL